MSIKILCIIALLFVSSLSQNNASNLQSSDFVSIDSKVKTQDEKQQKDIQSKFPSFVNEELKQAKSQMQKFKASQQFIVSLSPGQTFEFRYKIQSNPTPNIKILIFTQQSQDDIVMVKEHQIQSYVQVFSSTSLFGTYHSVGKAYLHKIVQLGSYSGSQIFVRLESHFQFDTIIQLTLSGPPLQVDRFNAIKNSQFSIMAKKLQAIQEEMKEVQTLNRNQFKFEWGFLEREQHYEEQMLKLTGFQALVILATSMVQIYCIKSLIDKNAVI